MLENITGKKCFFFGDQILPRLIKRPHLLELKFIPSYISWYTFFGQKFQGWIYYRGGCSVLALLIEDRNFSAQFATTTYSI